MSWFQLDPSSIAQRAREAGEKVPSLGSSVRRGIVGFTILSVAGFAPWALLGKWFHKTVGEAGMYAACAAVFIGLSGPLLHRLIIGAGSLARFYKLFAAAFAGYAVAWTIGWMTVHGHPGSVAGLLAGTAIMGWMLASAFDAGGMALKIIAALFVLNSLGYFAGGWVAESLMRWKDFSIFGTVVPAKTRITSAMLLWGVCYGLGFGAGVGAALHLCQTRARELLAKNAAVGSSP